MVKIKKLATARIAH